MVGAAGGSSTEEGRTRRVEDLESTASAEERDACHRRLSLAQTQKQRQTT